MRHILSFILIVYLLASVGCQTCKLPHLDEQASVTTVFIVRHAERPDGVDNLNSKGKNRAKLLAMALEATDVEVIYASTYARTQQTVKPIADKLGITVKLYDPSDLESLTTEIKTNHKGKVVLVAGHSNTVPETATHLGVVEELAHFHHNEYDNLYLVTLSDGFTPQLTKLKYGHMSHGH